MAFVSPFVGRTGIEEVRTSLREHRSRVTPVACQAHRSDEKPVAMSRRALLAAATMAAAGTLSFGFEQPALADFTVAAAKRSFDRYFPRIEEGYGRLLEIRDNIKDGDLEAAKAMVNDKVFDVRLRRAMTIYATSFSDASISQQSKELLACVDGFFDNLAKAVSSSSTEAAIEKYNTAAQAFNAYLRVARVQKKLDTEGIMI